MSDFGCTEGCRKLSPRCTITRNPKSDIRNPSWWYEGTKLEYLNRESYYLDLLYYRLCPVNTP